MVEGQDREITFLLQSECFSEKFKKIALGVITQTNYSQNFSSSSAYSFFAYSFERLDSN